MRTDAAPGDGADPHDAGAEDVAVSGADGGEPGAGDAAGSGPGDGDARGRRGPPKLHRLRDLDRRGRALAALCALLLLVPVGASVGRALAAGWLPSNDDALIVLQARDVFSSDPPLVGQPSTSERYTDGLQVRHPGAIEFYLLATPIRVLGPSLGTLLTAAALAGGSVLLTAWIAFRRAGPAAGLGATVLLIGAMWSSATAVLSDPISSNVGGYPLIAGTALAWALWCDDRRLWPVAVAVWSFTIQQHLAIFGMAGIVAAWGVAGAAVVTVRHRREVARLASSARWGAAAVAVGIVCWLPPLIDQVAGTGNLGRLLELSTHSDRPTLGLGRGLRVTGRALSVPPILTTRWLADDRLAGFELMDPMNRGQTAGAVVGVVLLLAAVAVAVVTRRGPGGSARLALAATAVVVALGGLLTATNVPFSLEASRINFYRWIWAAAVAAWGTIAWAAVTVLRPVLAGRTPAARSGWLPAAAVGTVLALVAGVGLATSTRTGYGDTRRDEGIFAFERDVLDQLEERLPPDRPVRLVAWGPAANISAGPALAAGLEDAGWEVRVDPDVAVGYGDDRAVPEQPGETRVLVASGAGEAPSDDGELLARVELPVDPGDEEQLWGDDVLEVRLGG